MRVPISWLSEYVEGLPDVDVLAEKLTMAGLEVEAVERPIPSLVDNLVIARIREVSKHPNAERLSICLVDDGSSLQSIVCGATNMVAGDAVVLAPPGTVLPGGLTIKRAKIRGEESNGMLCSASELGLSDDQEGILVLGPDANVGDKAASQLGLDEHVIEVSITPNRGDCLSIRGLAREISAIAGLRLTGVMTDQRVSPRTAARIGVRVESPQACLLYRGLELGCIAVGPSPAWLRSRLSASGLRPINNVVDVTNYVLLEYGQPLHAFDADRLEGETIVVRTVGRETDVETLDGQNRRLLPGDLAIWDARGPVAIAGVMGGARTAVGESTKVLFLESAMFAPTGVRATSRRLGLVSESSYRFERGIDPAQVEQALLRASELICDLAGGTVAGGVASGGPGYEPRDSIELRPKHVADVLGMEIPRHEIARSLEALGARLTEDAHVMHVEPPSHRHDLVREIDLIEEVVRLRGYDSVVEQPPSRVMIEASAPVAFTRSSQLRQRLAALGLTEVVGVAFCSPRMNALFPGLHSGFGALAIRNPLRADAAEMRRSLLPTLFDAHLTNVRTGARSTDLFVLGRTFRAGVDDAELDAVAGLLWGPRRARGPGDTGAATFWDVKGLVEGIAALFEGGRIKWQPVTSRPELHPRASASAEIAGSVVGYAGLVHPDVADTLETSHDVAIFEVDTRKLASYAPLRRRVVPVPRYPASSRDVSLLVAGDLLAGDVIEAIEALSEPLVESVEVFDEYIGEGIPPGRRALAFRIVYRSSDRTLTDDEVTERHERVLAALVERLDVALRT